MNEEASTVQNEKQTNIDNMQRRQNVEQIDLMEYGYVLLRKWWMIVLGGLIGAVLVGAYTMLMITPMYQSSATIYTIMSRTVEVANLSNISIGNQLTGDFLLVARSRPVLARVIDDLDLKMSTGELKGCVNVTQPEDTHMLVVTATNPDPELAMKIANDLAEVMCERVAEVMDTDKPYILEEAIAAGSPISPNLVKNVEKGGLAGILIVSAIIILLYMLNETINTEEDIKRYLGLPTLGMIPLERELK